MKTKELHFLNALALSQPDGCNNALVSLVIFSHYGNSITVYDEMFAFKFLVGFFCPPIKQTELCHCFTSLQNQPTGRIALKFRARNHGRAWPQAWNGEQDDYCLEYCVQISLPAASIDDATHTGAIASTGAT